MSIVNKSGIYTNWCFPCSHKHLACVFVFSLRLSCILQSVLCFWCSIFLLFAFQFHFSDLEVYQNQILFSRVIFVLLWYDQLCHYIEFSSPNTIYIMFIGESWLFLVLCIWLSPPFFEVSLIYHLFMKILLYICKIPLLCVPTAPYFSSKQIILYL